MIWKKEVSPEEINSRCANTFVEHLGIRFTEVGKDFMSAEMPFAKNLCQPMGIVHGGATATLAETVASAAANYCVEENQVGVGLELNINHIRAISKGVMKATCKPLHLGKSTQVWEILIQNESGQLTSAARLTIAVIAKEV